MEQTNRDVVVVPEPTGPGRRWIALAGTVWVAIQIAAALGYYLGDDRARPRQDERFAWRMFSAVRAEACALRVTETTGEGIARDLSVLEVLPAPWAILLERRHPRVAERFVAWRCAEPCAAAAVVLILCSAVSFVRGRHAADVWTAALALVVAAGVLLASLEYRDVRFDYWRFAAGDFRRRGEWAAALDAYQRADRHAPPGESRRAEVAEIRRRIAAEATLPPD